jgi:molybdopterin-guanine dinucleotide biosynthesis protein B
LVPIVCIVGKSNVGKTTLVVKIIKELRKRNYKVSTIKHDVHGFDIDKPGKDTFKHAQAGADSVMISSPNKIAMIKKVEEELSLDKLIQLNNDSDIIIAEGFKTSDKPKIEVIRSEKYTESICRKEDLIAIASDINHNTQGIPVFDLNDSVGLVDTIEEKILNIGKCDK